MTHADLGNIKEAKAVLALAETEHSTQCEKERTPATRGQDSVRPSPADQDIDGKSLWKVDGDIQRGLEAMAKALARKGDLSGAMAVAR